MDFTQFENDLYIFGLNSFQRIRDMRPDDRFYCFAFFTSGEFGYISTTASSYEGLEEAAQWYKSQERYSHQSLEELRRELKWSPGDSPLHQECGEILEPLKATMDQIAGELHDTYLGDEDWTRFDDYVSNVEDAIAAALRRIDREGVFGRGSEREGVVTNLLMGDQTYEARIEFAKKVNPPKAVQMLMSDLDA
jgi:hypothetical protein